MTALLAVVRVGLVQGPPADGRGLQELLGADAREEHEEMHGD